MANTYSTTYDFSPNLPIIINYDKATPVPINIDLLLGMWFVKASGNDPVYDNFFLRVNVVHPKVGLITIRPITFSGEVISAPQEMIPVNLVGYNETTISLNFSNLATTLLGNHETKISFMLLGQTFEGNLAILDVVTDSIFTNITGSGGGEPPVEEIGISPNDLVFSHALTQGLPLSQSVAVNSAGPFQVTISGPIHFSGSGVALVSNINGVKTYTGSAATTVNVSLTQDISATAIGVHEFSAVFTQTGSSRKLIGNLAVTVYLFENTDLVINPPALEFFAIKNIQEAPSQTIQVAGSPSFTLTRPSWVSVSPSTGKGFTEIVITPNPTVNLDEGEYKGNIVINDGVNDYIVPILHNVYGSVQLGAGANKLNFTDDYGTISRFYEKSGYKLMLNLDVHFYNYGSTLLNETVLQYVLGFFNNRLSFFIGKTLNSIMKELLSLKSIRMENLLPDAYENLLPIRNYYLPSVVTVTAHFKHDYDALLDKTHVFENIKFIKGRRPKTPFEDTFILDYYRDPLRVTVNSVAMLNFYKENNHTLRIYKNSQYQNSVGHAVGSQRIFGHKLKFNLFAPGDVVEVRLYKNIDGAVNDEWYSNTANYIAQQYILIPEGKASHHIGYEDEYGLLKIIEFTGSIRFENAYENTVAKNYVDFLETLKKLDSKKSRKCTINTGPIFKVNTKNIDALLSSKRAWIISEEDKQSISMIALNKTMADEDTDQDIYTYDIEFDINFNNDFEINT